MDAPLFPGPTDTWSYPERGLPSLCSLLPLVGERDCRVLMRLRQAALVIIGLKQRCCT
jgi:hypothetical protein